MASRFVLPFADVGNGISPSDGAKLFFFAAGTSTPKNTFSDSAGTIANTNPVIADSTGTFSDIFISGTYKVQLKDKNDVLIWEADPVFEPATSSTSSISFTNVAAMVASSIDSGQLVETKGYTTAGDGGGAKYFTQTSAEFGGTPDEQGASFTLANGNIAVLQDGGRIHSAQFGADGSGNDTVPIQKAASAANGIILEFDGSLTYQVDSFTLPNNARVITNGCVFQDTGVITGNTATITSGSNTSVDQIRVSVPTLITRDRIVTINSDNFNCDYIEVISADQQANTGENLDGAIQLRSRHLNIGNIKVVNFDHPVVAFGASDIKVDFINIESYTRGVYVSSCNDVYILGANIETASPNSSTAAGNNGLLAESNNYLHCRGWDIKNAGEHGVRIGGSSDSKYITLEDFTVYSPGKCGIKVRPNDASRVRFIRILNPTCIDCGSGTIDVNEDGLLIERVVNCQIENPIIYPDVQAVSCNDGINVYKADFLTIVGGQIFDVNRSGIYLKPDSVDDLSNPETADINQLKIDGTRISTSNAAGITVEYTGVNLRHLDIDAQVISAATFSIEYIDAGGGVVAQKSYVRLRSTGAGTADVGGSGYLTATLGVQLGDTTYHGFVGADGITGNDLPDGVTASKVSTGVYDITHGFGIGEKTIVPLFTPYNVNVFPIVLAASTTTATRVSWRDAAGTLTDTEFYFTLTVPNRNRP